MKPEKSGGKQRYYTVELRPSQLTNGTSPVTTMWVYFVINLLYMLKGCKTVSLDTSSGWTTLSVCLHRRCAPDAWPFSWISSGPILKVSCLFVLGVPELNKALQVGYHQSRGTESPLSTCCHPSFDAVQDMVGFLDYKHTQPA